MQKLSLFLFSLVFSISAYAAEKPYITHNQLNIIQLLPNPVANGSAEDKIEQDYVLAAQKNATSERIALANADAEETVFAMFKSILGPEFNPDKLPETARFFERIGETSGGSGKAIRQILFQAEGAGGIHCGGGQHSPAVAGEDFRAGIDP